MGPSTDARVNAPHRQEEKLDKGCDRGRRAQEPARHMGMQRATSLVNPRALRKFTAPDGGGLTAG